MSDSISVRHFQAGSRQQQVSRVPRPVLETMQDPDRLARYPGPDPGSYRVEGMWHRQMLWNSTQHDDPFASRFTGIVIAGHLSRVDVFLVLKTSGP